MQKAAENYRAPQVFLEVMGMQHFSSKSLSRLNSEKNISIYRISYMCFVLSIVISSMLLTTLTLGQTMCNFNGNIKNVLLLAISQSLQLTRLIFIASSILESFTRNREIKEIHLNSENISQILVDKFDFTGSNQMKVSVWRKFVVFSTIFSVVFSSLSAVRSGFSLKLLTMPIVFSVSLLLLSTILRIFFNAVTVNEQLENLNSALWKIYSPTPIRIIDNIFLYLENSNVHCDPLCKLKQARIIYNLINKNVALINQSCGLTTLMFFILAIAFLISKGYEMFTMIIRELSPERIPSEYQSSLKFFFEES
jgi:hypothetical protein